jgi:hypothetical protein
MIVQGDNEMDKATNKRIGRPTKPPTPGERVALGLRVTADVKNKLEKAAVDNGRSLSQEAEFRLERSFEREALSAEIRQDLRTNLGDIQKKLDRWEGKFWKEYFRKARERYEYAFARAGVDPSTTVGSVKRKAEWSRLDDATFKRMSEQWGDALTRAGVDPSTPVGSLTRSPDWERVSEVWSSYFESYPRNQSIPARNRTKRSTSI